MYVDPRNNFKAFFGFKPSDGVEGSKWRFESQMLLGGFLGDWRKNRWFEIYSFDVLGHLGRLIELIGLGWSTGLGSGLVCLIYAAAGGLACWTIYGGWMPP